jgi:DNA end-binding protein Ku
MAARALQSITITFGLVTIPVKVYAATNARAGVSFNLLHKCGSRVKQQYHCIAEDVDVPRDELVKGYEFEKDHFVTFTKEELEALDEEASGAVEITEFVDATSVDPVYYEKAYYLGPDKGGAKPYALLSEAMRQSSRTAIGRWAARGKQYLVQLRVTETGLVMQQLLYANEVRAMSEVEIAGAKVSPKELELAAQLIGTITSEEGFDASKYKDEVAERIQAQIQRKIDGKEITAPEAPVAPEGAQVIDLMEALKASLRSGVARPRKAAAPAPAPSPRERAVASAADAADTADAADDQSPTRNGGKSARKVGKSASRDGSSTGKVEKAAAKTEKPERASKTSRKERKAA